MPSLKAHNTFGIDVQAAQILSLSSNSDLTYFSDRSLPSPFIILGGGSNVLFTKDWTGTVLLNRFKGIRIDWINENEALVCAKSGEVWHQLVLQTLEWGLGGLENLSLIPGTVGAAPIQNIGAYGVELTDVFDHLTAFKIESGEFVAFNREECAFGYRDSYFKNEGKGKYFITEVCLKLSRKSPIRAEYGDIKQILQDKLIEIPTHKDISEAVCQIRRSKLPDPEVLGNAGSFFKNPVISNAQFEALKTNHPDIPGYPDQTGNTVKVPAGWLIEKCGWKGKRINETGSHTKQALVLVNYGNASGEEIYQLAQQIMHDVLNKFGINIQTEVNIL